MSTRITYQANYAKVALPRGIQTISSPPSFRRHFKRSSLPANRPSQPRQSDQVSARWLSIRASPYAPGPGTTTLGQAAIRK